MAGTGEKRVALVIGNAVYEHAAALETPVNDARTIGSVLSRLGFSGMKPQFNFDTIEFRRFGRLASGLHAITPDGWALLAFPLG